MFSKATENNSLFFIQKIGGASLFCCLKTTPKLPSLGKYAIIMLTFFQRGTMSAEVVMGTSKTNCRKRLYLMKTQAVRCLSLIVNEIRLMEEIPLTS